MNGPTLARRYPARAAMAGARWLLNPVSTGGAKQVPRMQLYATGPELLAAVEQMRAHPTGKRVLADRPELGSILMNMPALAALPEGSLGRAYHDSMSVPGGVPGYLLAGLIYADGFFDRYDMPDDARYVIERSRWLHDLLHVLTGLPRPLAQVRDELAIVAFEEDTSDWLSTSWLGRRAATGFGTYARAAEQAKLTRRIVEVGVDFRDVMRAPPERVAALRSVVAEGADDAAIRAAAGRLL